MCFFCCSGSCLLYYGEEDQADLGLTRRINAMRFNFISILGLLSVAVANAGQIQLGGTNGLTYNYITQASGAVCAAGTGNCLAGSPGGNATAPGNGSTGFIEKNYDVKLFQGATESSVMPVPYTGYNQTAGEVGTDALTMLNNVWGTASSSADTQVTFDFGTSSNTATFNNVVVVTLQNSPSGTSGLSGGEISASIDCSTATICTDANGAPSDESVATATLNGNPTAGVFVDGGTLFNSAYNTITSGSFMGSAGTLNLDYQDFLLGSLVAPNANEYLVNIKVTELTGGAGVSATSLSAVTIDTVPEPTTIMLFLSGLGALGIARFRRKA
jgi:hypothetical protein